MAGIDVARANPPRLDRAPAVAAAVLVFFEDEVALFAGVEVPHLRILFLHLLEVVQDRLAAARELHLGAEIHVDVVVVSQRVVGIHDVLLGCSRTCEIGPWRSLGICVAALNYPSPQVEPDDSTPLLCQYRMSTFRLSKPQFWPANSRRSLTQFSDTAATESERRFVMAQTRTLYDTTRQFDGTIARPEIDCRSRGVRHRPRLDGNRTSRRGARGHRIWTCSRSVRRWSRCGDYLERRRCGRRSIDVRRCRRTAAIDSPTSIERLERVCGGRRCRLRRRRESTSGI